MHIFAAQQIPKVVIGLAQFDNNDSQDGINWKWIVQT